jgi:hypothetical protein
MCTHARDIAETSIAVRIIFRHILNHSVQKPLEILFSTPKYLQS